MKSINIIWIAVLVSLLLVIAGCGKESEPAVSEEVSEPEESGAEEPVLPDAGVEDLDSDITEEAVSPDEDYEEAEGEVVDYEEAEDSEVEDSEEDALTAENYKVISLKDLKAYPEELRITVGTTVEWRNVNDNLLHIIGWRGQKQMGVDPEPMKAGESWSYTFTEPGEIIWFSTARPTIQGTIYIGE